MAPVDTDPHTLREYALLADGERGALVGPSGDFVWMCFPSWDSDALFSSLAGGAGGYTIEPADRFVWGGYYEHGSLIWRSRWVTVENALIECRAALALPAQRDRAVVLRRVLAVRDTARVHVSLNLRAAFGDEPIHGLHRDDAGIWRGRVGQAFAAWSGAERARPEPDGHRGKTLRLELELAEGDHHDFVLVLAMDRDGVDPPDPDTAWSGTAAAWRERVPDLDDVPGARDGRHAYAVLNGLTSGGGGMVAAATTSMPERARGGRNYDYRYVWIRDQCFAGQAVGKHGPHPLLDSAVRFVAERLLDDGRALMPAYTTEGLRVPDERRLELVGYPGADVVVGNHVNKQFQLDAFGESLLLFATAARHDRLERRQLERRGDGGAGNRAALVRA